MRQWINLVEGLSATPRNEVKFWLNPKTDELLTFPMQDHHENYTRKHPRKFGASSLNVALQNGWVRGGHEVNYAKGITTGEIEHHGGIFLHASSMMDLRRAVRSAIKRWPDLSYINLWLTDSDWKGGETSLRDHDEIDAFIKYGKVPGHDRVFPRRVMNLALAEATTRYDDIILDPTRSQLRGILAASEYGQARIILFGEHALIGEAAAWAHYQMWDRARHRFSELTAIDIDDCKHGFIEEHRVAFYGNVHIDDLPSEADDDLLGYLVREHRDLYAAVASNRVMAHLYPDLDEVGFTLGDGTMLLMRRNGEATIEHIDFAQEN